MSKMCYKRKDKLLVKTVLLALKNSVIANNPLVVHLNIFKNGIFMNNILGSMELNKNF